MYLLNTDVGSAARRAARHPRVVRWLAAQDERSLYLSVISLGEIARGIHL
ncbi:MAG: hypothetical protein AAFP13_07845 [Pseudomonadota bacterium]